MDRERRGKSSWRREGNNRGWKEEEVLVGRVAKRLEGGEEISGRRGGKAGEQGEELCREEKVRMERRGRKMDELGKGRTWLYS